MSREALFAAFFFAVFLFLLYQLYLFVAAFFAPLVWAAILALTFYPLTARLVQAFRGRRSLAAFTLVLAVTVLAIIPSFFLGSLLVNQATAAYGRVQQAVQQGDVTLVDQIRASRLGGLWVRIEPLAAQLSIDVSDLVLRATDWLSDQIVEQATNLARNVLVSAVNFLIMLVALFFLFRDGEALAARLRDLLPMEREHKDAIFTRLYATLTAVVQSMIVTSATQGVLAGLGYWLIADLSFPTFLGFLTGLASFLPLAGPAFVWGGTAVYLAATEHVGRAVGLVLWGALAVSSADNWIKPLFIGGRARLPTFPLLIAILGGLKVYGFLGVFLGPVVLAILFTFIEIYHEEYQEEDAISPGPRERRGRAASA
ncbi:MAG TPA: AI-2E family transporter [Candidatus Nitrosopolaris sp.]|nr:AI-2E family transporter [Candidatus Nitrosopolaris sp.]